MIHEAVDEEGDIRHEFTHQRRIQLIDGPLQDVGLSDAFEEYIKVLAVGDETGFIQVSFAAIARGMIVFVSPRVLVTQNEHIIEVNLERLGLFLENFLSTSL